MKYFLKNSLDYGLKKMYYSNANVGRTHRPTKTIQPFQTGENTMNNSKDRIFNTDDTDRLYELATKTAYSVLKKCYDTSGDETVRRLMNDIVAGHGDGVDLVQTACLALLECKEGDIINLDKLVPYKTKRYDNTAREYAKEYISPIQYAWRAVRSKIILASNRTNIKSDIYLNDLSEKELASLADDGGLEKIETEKSSGNSSCEEFEKILNTVQHEVLRCMYERMTESQISIFLDISINSVKSSKREIRRKAKEYFKLDI